MNQTYLEAGQFINLHGFRGTLKAEPWTNSADDFRQFKTLYLEKNGEYVALPLTHAAPTGRFVLLTISGYDSEEKSRELLNKTFFVKREDLNLPKGKTLIVDLIGGNCIDNATGETVGKIKDYTDNGFCRYYVVENKDGEHLIPDLPTFIAKTEPGNVYVNVMEGLL